MRIHAKRWQGGGVYGHVKSAYEQQYPCASEVMTPEEFEGLVDVFRTLLQWSKEAEADKENGNECDNN